MNVEMLELDCWNGMRSSRSDFLVPFRSICLLESLQVTSYPLSFVDFVQIPRGGTQNTFLINNNKLQWMVKSLVYVWW